MQVQVAQVALGSQDWIPAVVYHALHALKLEQPSKYVYVIVQNYYILILF